MSDILVVDSLIFEVQNDVGFLGVAQLTGVSCHKSLLGTVLQVAVFEGTLDPKLGATRILGLNRIKLHFLLRWLFLNYRKQFVDFPDDSVESVIPTLNLNFSHAFSVVIADPRRFIQNRSVERHLSQLGLLHLLGLEGYSVCLVQFKAFNHVLKHALLLNWLSSTYQKVCLRQIF